MSWISTVPVRTYSTVTEQAYKIDEADLTKDEGIDTGTPLIQ